MLRLSCAVQTYDWGTPGKSSTVAQLKASGDENGFEPKEGLHYAELWMGTHPSGPSKVLPADGGSAILLRDYLEKHPEVLGNELSTSAFPGDLPFMFKVLSISKALSIQAHPDKALAERLHAARPNDYKDDNHKPEMAISLTDFEALCGFRPLEEIVEHIKTYPELKALISDEAFAQIDPLPSSEDEQKAALKAVFSSYMSASDEDASEQVAAVAKRLASVENRSPLESLLLRLNKHYPGDRGLFGPLFLNYVRLGPGKAFVMAANEPHAYLRGDILECMACSDNVVRVGLTPKYKDVSTLLNMLTYNSGEMKTIEGDIVDKKRAYRRFTPDNIKEFEVETIRLSDQDSLCVLPIDSPSILLVLDGAGWAWIGGKEEEKLKLKKGVTYFITANTPIELEGSGETALHVTIAHSNLKDSR